jgi:predicted HD phosphohydrolase
VVYDVERKQVLKRGEQRVYTHVHIRDHFTFELTVYPADKAHYVFRSSVTGKAIERASISQLEQLLAAEYPETSLDQTTLEAESKIDRFLVYHMLLLPLEQVKQSRQYHPEGDALYHSLQTFDLARDERPYDEEFLLAALLHDVGKAIDPQDHIGAALEALDGFITRRTAWLIEHHADAHALLDGTLGVRSRRRLEASEDYEELRLLAECDRAARQTGVEVPDAEEAIEYLRDLAESCGDWSL